MWQERLDFSYGPAPEDQSGAAYNQQAFRHFLAIERKRVRRSGRSFSLLLVTLRTPAGTTAAIDPIVAADVFSVLGSCVRTVDFTGWYRDGRAVGAVLALGPKDLHDEARAAVCARVADGMRRRLPVDVFNRLHIRALQLPWRPKCTAA